MKFKDLPEVEQETLNQIYGLQFSGSRGYNPNTITYVEKISEKEKPFFDKNNLISANQFVQKLYKISGNLIPLRFNLAVSNLIKNIKELSMNYCQVDNRILKISLEKHKEKPEIVYRNLENTPNIDETMKTIIDADMRKNLDLRYDNLIRFSVFHTGDEEYAVLITVARLIENTFDVKNFFREVMKLELIIPKKEKIKAWTSLTSESIKNYWLKVLEDMPILPLLPYSRLPAVAYKQKSSRFIIPAEIMSDIREKAKSNKMMLMTIFATAWGILLQEYNKSQDVAFATLVPSKVNENFYMIPIRLQTNNQISIQEIVNQQFKQLIISQSYASLQIIEPQGKHFDHFLNFSDFLRDETLYSMAEAKPDGQLVLQNSWNTQGVKLGLYFHYSENVTSISILYDANKFKIDFAELLSRRYLLILQQMLTDWNLPYEKFIERFSNRTKDINKEDEKENYTNYLQNFVSQLELLKDVDSSIVQQILQLSKVETYFEGDRISATEMEQNLIFVMEGKLVRSIETNDGWYKTLDIIKENGWVNETIFLEKRRNNMSAEVLTEKAVLMTAPFKEMKYFLRGTFPDIEYNVLQYSLSQMEKYQRLWVQS